MLIHGKKGEKMKTALFAFNGEPLCFVHMMLNAIDLNERGHEVRVIIEGSAIPLLVKLNQEDNKFHKLYMRFRPLIDCVCRSCALKQGVAKEISKQDIQFGDDMNGHPAIGSYIDEGYRIITF